jgi:hypothetical protein
MQTLPTLSGVVASAVLFCGTPGVCVAAELTSADSAVALVRPSDMPGLPKPLQKALEKCHCRIPQVYGGNRFNAIEGEFERQGQRDWAVLCSRKGVSTIYVFWGGSPRHYDRIAAEADRPTPDERGRAFYPRSIRIGGAERVVINDEPERHGLPNPERDVLVDASAYRDDVLYYRHQGRWVKLDTAE